MDAKSVVAPILSLETYETGVYVTIYNIVFRSF